MDPHGRRDIRKRTKHWLVRHFSRQDLQRLTGDATRSSVDRVLRALDRNDMKLLHWLRDGCPRAHRNTRQHQLRALLRAVLDPARARQVPLLWCVLNPPGRAWLAAGGQTSDTATRAAGFYRGARVWIGIEEATLISEALPLYHVKYTDGKKYEGIEHAQIFKTAAAQRPKSGAYHAQEKVWVRIPGLPDKYQAAITKAVPRWRVRMALTGTERVVKASSIRVHDNTSLFHVSEDDQKYSLRGMWKDAKEQAREVAQNTVLAATRQALREIEEAAKQGAERGVRDAQRDQEAAASSRRGAARGAFTHRQRQDLLDAIHRGAVEGVTGAAVDDHDQDQTVYEYEEAANVPVAFATLPPAASRIPPPPPPPAAAAPAAAAGGGRRRARGARRARRARRAHLALEGLRLRAPNALLAALLEAAAGGSSRAVGGRAQK